MLRKRKTIHLFCCDKETATESETFFSGMALGDFNAETVFAEQEDFFLHDSNIDEKEGTTFQQ